LAEVTALPGYAVTAPFNLKALNDVWKLGDRARKVAISVRLPQLSWSGRWIPGDNSLAPGIWHAVEGTRRDQYPEVGLCPPMVLSPTPWLHSSREHADQGIRAWPGPGVRLARRRFYV